MGHFFVMSTRFNKCDASDFGLLPLAEDMALSPNDGSIWAKTELYNFGWGDENGYYRYPMPSFEKLFHLVLNSADEEDIYGAASVILKRYPDELLKQCEAIAENRGRSDDFGKLVKFFDWIHQLTEVRFFERHMRKFSKIQDDGGKLLI